MVPAVGECTDLGGASRAAGSSMGRVNPRPSVRKGIGRILSKTNHGDNGMANAFKVLRLATAGPAPICWPSWCASVRPMHAAHSPSVDRWGLAVVRVDFAVAVAHGRAPEALSGVYLGTVYGPIALAPGETFRQTTRWRFKR
jgi:hypothetical protein